MLQLKEEDVQKFLAAQAHIGDHNVTLQMAQYVYKVRSDGTPLFNLKKTWEKLLMAARIIVAIENPADICVISSRTVGQRGILKFAHHIGATAVAGKFTPGTFTNQIQKAFKEPRLLIVGDPRTDHQPVTEASYVNIPVIAFCNTNTPLKNIDVAIPCNSNAKHSVGLMWWLLAREVLRLRGAISRDLPWDVMPDLYFYRDPEDIEREEQEQAKIAEAEVEKWGGQTTDDQWGETAQTDWGTETAPQPAAGTTTTTAGVFGTADQDWNVASSTTKDWGADDTAGDWKEPTTTEGAGW